MNNVAKGDNSGERINAFCHNIVKRNVHQTCTGSPTLRDLLRARSPLILAGPDTVIPEARVDNSPI